jgi:hypothetical protein
MWRIVAGILWAVAFLQAQTFQDLLLPQARHIAGIVVDSEGRPIADAHIDHSNDRGRTHQSDTSGGFELDTRAPILVVRKQGYRSEMVHTQDAKDMRVTLQQAGEKRIFPTCSKDGSYVGIDGSGALFQFLRVPDVKATPRGRDVDYSARGYYIKTKSGTKGIRHGSGPMWDFGMPSDQDVWRSVSYEEIAYDFGNLTIIDARGQLPNRLQWRYLGMFGESASYSGVDETTAKVLDKFLDGACIKPVASK